MANITKIRYEIASEIPSRAAADLAAGTLVAVTAGGINPTVNAATAGGHPLGVVAHSVKSGNLVTVHRNVVAEVRCTGSIAAGDAIAAGANGVAVKAAEGAPVIGTAVEASANSHVYVVLN
ncbi:capsid cement protein [Corynebacteriaceae bacterium 6-324]